LTDTKIEIETIFSIESLPPLHFVENHLADRRLADNKQSSRPITCRHNDGVMALSAKTVSAKHCVGQMSVGKMSVGQMSFDQVTPD
jgi:hypothetical protein